MNWQPSATIQALRSRAEIITTIRNFFMARGVLEVETPLLGYTTATDPYLSSFVTQFCDTNSDTPLFLQTSPEFHMKRLLAAGSGPIFQLCKAFRNGEIGQRHNPEFTILEWYRPDFDHHRLMDEVDELLKAVLQCSSAQRMSYHELFLHFLDIHPHRCEKKVLINSLKKNHIHMANPEKLERDSLLDILLTHLIEPKLGLENPVFVYDYPATQAALARIRQGEYPVGERFEAYYKGIELANGYHELCDPQEQYERFIADNEYRTKLALDNIPIDKKLLAALHDSFPRCSGVALGIDRLIMLALQTNQIKNVMSFTWDYL